VRLALPLPLRVGLHGLRHRLDRLLPTLLHRALAGVHDRVVGLPEVLEAAVGELAVPRQVVGARLGAGLVHHLVVCPRVGVLEVADRGRRAVARGVQPVALGRVRYLVGDGLEEAVLGRVALRVDEEGPALAVPLPAGRAAELLGDSFASSGALASLDSSGPLGSSAWACCWTFGSLPTFIGVSSGETRWRQIPTF